MGEESPAAGKPSGTALPRRGKSCKGCLYYSSMLRSRGFNPVCVGIPRSIPQGYWLASSTYKVEVGPHLCNLKNGCYCGRRLVEKKSPNNEPATASYRKEEMNIEQQSALVQRHEEERFDWSTRDGVVL
ncbi:hypothetical protein OsI_32137 [Oryza sativa Indica Group]|uniref:DUF8204 domain-containing protein n=1 Tax=Oryza sativa subsp. indica TaxID=39946 RepID=B8BDT7_ORYSI|nr:hypothetical protein OsI_32137 [Oryza sativa Indica Group]